MYISNQWSKIDQKYCMKINPKFKLLTSYWLPLKYEFIFRFLGTSLTDLSDLTSITLNLILLNGLSKNNLDLGEICLPSDEF